MNINVSTLFITPIACHSTCIREMTHGVRCINVTYSVQLYMTWTLAGWQHNLHRQV